VGALATPHPVGFEDRAEGHLAKIGGEVEFRITARGYATRWRALARAPYTIRNSSLSPDAGPGQRDPGRSPLHTGDDAATARGLHARRARINARR